MTVPCCRPGVPGGGGGQPPAWHLHLTGPRLNHPLYPLHEVYPRVCGDTGNTPATRSY